MRWRNLKGCLVLGVILAAWAVGLLAGGGEQFLGRLQPLGRDFLIIAHRGAPNQACENTLESFAQALRLGANALEFDVSMTRDEHLVLWHDWNENLIHRVINTVRPTGVCDVVRPPLFQSVHEIALETFVQHYGYEQEGQWVPATTFAAFVRRFAQDRRVRVFFLDFKVPSHLPDLVDPMFQRAVQTLRQDGALSKAVFLTPHTEIFFRLHEAAQHWYDTTGERVEVAFDLEGPQVFLWEEWPSTVRYNQAAKARFALWGQPVVTLQSLTDFLIAEIWRRDAVNARRPLRAQMRFIVWTVNDPSEMCALLRLGVDGIITDEPGQLRAIVGNWGRPGTCSVA
jgi:glycerophosphoryl diester phosphodiesterase